MKITKRWLTSFIILSLFLISQISSGAADLSKDNATEPSDAISNIYIRKVLAEISLDYQDAGANNKHDSQRGKPGIGFRIP